MDHEGDAPPSFWFQPPPTTQRRRSSSPTLNPVAFIITVPILALILIAFILIPLLSNVSQFLKAPTSIKKGWDSLNILLVLLAIVCGVLLRQENDDEGSVLDPVTQNVSDQEVYHNFPEGSGAGGKLMRSSSSFPDLRSTENNRAYRFYDDFDLNIYSQDHNLHNCVSTYPAITRTESLPEPEAAAAPRQPYDEQAAPPQQQQPKEDEAQQLKEDEPAPQQEEDEQQPAKEDEAPLKRRRSARKESMKRRAESNHLDKTDTRSLPCSRPPVEKTEMLQRKKSGATKEIATAIASLYNRAKKNKRKLRIRSIHDDATMIRSGFEASTITPSTPPPPPPPPPPPLSVFHNMFKKGNKSKKIHSLSLSVPPPPPPPSSIFNNIFKNTTGTSKRFNSTPIPTPPPPPPPPRSSILNNFSKPAKTIKRTSSPPPLPLEPQSRRQKPPLPPKTKNCYQSTGAKSPVVPVPPPPFKMQQASTSETQTPRAVDVFCPSPDVNTKADNFIARLRDEWRLEKMNSLSAKQ